MTTTTIKPTNPVLLKQSVNGGGSDISLRDLVALELFARAEAYDLSLEPTDRVGMEDNAHYAFECADAFLAARAK